MWFYVNTLQAKMFDVSDFCLETRVIIKIFKKMISGMKTKVVSLENTIFFCFFVFLKKNQSGRPEKSSFSISANSQYFFVKIL